MSLMRAPAVVRVLMPETTRWAAGQASAKPESASLQAKRRVRSRYQPSAFGVPSSVTIKLGAVHYLTKPAEVEEILAAFDRTEPVLLDAPPPTKATPLDELEWEHLQRVLTDCNGNISEAARRLGMHRRSLQRKLARGRKEADSTRDSSCTNVSEQNVQRAEHGFTLANGVNVTGCNTSRAGAPAKCVVCR